MRSTSALASAAIICLASAKTIRVDVGNGGLKFSPNSTAADVGDVVEFHFFPKNHNVVQTSFDSPCAFGSFANPIYSGFVPSSSGEAGNVFQVTVADTKPIWYYCGQVSHCQAGMVGVINPPSSGPNTLDAFKEKANTVSESTNPSSVNGGVLVAAGSSASASASGASASAASSAGSSAASAASSASAAASTTAGGAYGGSTTAASSSAAATQSKSAGDAIHAMRWSELLGMGVAVGGAALLMQ